ncbi:MAG: hypothetical protein [Caudoviricetes sp.]|nr:MAG: hypothetical protein [Caudoviricetes sp.]
MNLAALVASQIEIVVPKLPISLTFYDSQTLDATGAPIVTSTTIDGLLAQVELAGDQDLKFEDGINKTSVYTKFYIYTDNISGRRVTGLNRNLADGGTYIVLDGLNYRIVKVLENFRVGWIDVIAEQSTTRGSA